MEQLKFIGKRLLYLLVMLLGVATAGVYSDEMHPRRPHSGELKPAGLK